MNKLRDYRMKKGLTQDELACLICVDRSTISKWENGENYPKIDRLFQISRVLEVTIDQLLENIK